MDTYKINNGNNTHWNFDGCNGVKTGKLQGSVNRFTVACLFTLLPRSLPWRSDSIHHGLYILENDMMAHSINSVPRKCRQGTVTPLSAMIGHAYITVYSSLKKLCWAHHWENHSSNYKPPCPPIAGKMQSLWSATFKVPIDSSNRSFSSVVSLKGPRHSSLISLWLLPTEWWCSVPASQRACQSCCRGMWRHPVYTSQHKEKSKKKN